MLDAYVPAEHYTKGAYIDAQDTTNVFIMAKVREASNSEISVNFDGWSEKWNYVSAGAKAIRVAVSPCV